MSFNLRVMKFKDSYGDAFYEIRSVYYNKAGEPESYADCSEPAAFSWDEGDDPNVVLERFKKALEKPVLVFENGVFTEKKP